MTRISASTALLALAGLPLLAACESMAGMAHPSPSTQAGIENDIMAARPASNVGLAPPIEITSPTR
jgi:hypothetical protein